MRDELQMVEWIGRGRFWVKFARCEADSQTCCVVVAERLANVTSKVYSELRQANYIYVQAEFLILKSNMSVVLGYMNEYISHGWWHKWVCKRKWYSKI